MPKGQIISGDFMISIALFLVMLAIIIPIFMKMTDARQEKQAIDDIQTKILFVSDALLKTQGSPDSWNETNAIAIGLMNNDGTINKTKIKHLVKMDTTTAKNLLTLGGFEFNVSFKTGSYPMMTGLVVSPVAFYSGTDRSLFNKVNNSGLVWDLYDGSSSAIPQNNARNVYDGNDAADGHWVFNIMIANASAYRTIIISNASFDETDVNVNAIQAYLRGGGTILYFGNSSIFKSRYNMHASMETPQIASSYSITKSASSFYSSGSGTAWSNPSNAQLSDNSYATSSVSNALTTQSLAATNFGFNIPAGATITGVKIDVEKKATHNGIPDHVVDNSVTLVKNGVSQGSDLKTGSFWPTADTDVLYGGLNSNWGLPLTPAYVDSNDFGVQLSAKLDVSWFTPDTTFVDTINMTIYYNVSYDGIAKDNVLIDTPYGTAVDFSNPITYLYKAPGDADLQISVANATNQSVAYAGWWNYGIGRMYYLADVNGGLNGTSSSLIDSQNFIGTKAEYSTGPVQTVVSTVRSFVTDTDLNSIGVLTLAIGKS